MTTTIEAPLVTVILPTFNRRQTIVRAIMSVLNQDYRNLELIVVDDGSTDDTAQLVSAIDDPRIRFIHLKDNAGASRARNVGLRAAKGELIAFQDSDDEWLHGKLARQVAAATASADKDLAVFHVKIIQGIDNNYNYGKTRLSYIPLLGEGKTKAELMKIIQQRNVISPQTLLFSRSCLDTIGYFDECLVNSVDWDFAIRLIHHADVTFIDEPLVMTYTQDSSISRLKKRAARSQLRIALKLLRHYDVDRDVLGGHFARVGMVISKFGKPMRGRKLLRKSVALNPANAKNWARLAVTECMAIAYPITERAGWRYWKDEFGPNK